MSKLSFSGHESFQCRNLWLKKGFEFARSEQKFSSDLAVVHLGVGKNMVSSIRYWLKSFGILNEEDQLETTAYTILDENLGKDPYLEDLGTLWLLHLQLVRTGKASIYSLFFNQFRKQRIEFSKKQLKKFLIAECDHRAEKHSEKTLDTDIGVFLKTYVRPTTKTALKDIEDTFSSLLMDLNLISSISHKSDRYECRNDYRSSLPVEIVLYSILTHKNFKNSRSISFHRLLTEDDSPGMIFALDADSLLGYIHEITRMVTGAVYKEDAGIRELQFRKFVDPIKVLEGYYE